MFRAVLYAEEFEHSRSGELSELADFTEGVFVDNLDAATIHHQYMLAYESGKRTYGIGGGHI